MCITMMEQTLYYSQRYTADHFSIIIATMQYSQNVSLEMM